MVMSRGGGPTQVRVKPTGPGDKTCVDVPAGDKSITVQTRFDSKQLTFDYDYVCKPSCSQVRSRQGLGPTQSTVYQPRLLPCGCFLRMQADIFDAVGKTMCDQVLQGFNATIFAYGQTGAGKTFTMQGDEDMENLTAANRGLIPRTFDYIFEQIEAANRATADSTYSCKCTYIEVYQVRSHGRRSACWWLLPC